MRVKSSGLRRASGQQMMEFPLCLFSIMFLVFFPICNAIASPLALMGLDRMASDICLKAAVAEDREVALNVITQQFPRSLETPANTGLHKVEESDKAPGKRLLLVVHQADGKENVFDAGKALPDEFKPEHGNNRSKLNYTYRFETGILVLHPIINLESIPVLNQFPIVAAPSEIKISKEETVRNIASLNY